MANNFDFEAALNAEIENYLEENHKPTNRRNGYSNLNPPLLKQKNMIIILIDCMFFDWLLLNFSQLIPTHFDFFLISRVINFSRTM